MRLDDICFTSTQLSKALRELGIVHTQAQVAKVKNVSLRSQDASESVAFIAVKGSTRDGNKYIADALNRGANLVLCQRAGEFKDHPSVIELANLQPILPTILQTVYLAEKTIEHITAVTGTNGKTSVTHLYSQLAIADVQKSASLGTLGLRVCEREQEGLQCVDAEQSLNTTPDIITQFKVLRLLANENVRRYCLEASSHGLEQGRLQGMPIKCAIFTNLSQDHLDYHKDMQSYAKAKRKLLAFKGLQDVVMNADDPESVNWARETEPNAKLAWFSLNKDNIPNHATRFAYAQNIQASPKGISFQLHSSWGSRKVTLPLLGRFNVANFLAACTAHLVQGASLDALLALCENLQGVPGRMELFVPKAAHGSLIVDYAHTHDALEQALRAARLHVKDKLYCVFGCGGDRDAGKRPLMGQVAETFADCVVLTQDNTRNESPKQIIKDIQSGMHAPEQAHIELEREAAVKWAWQNSQANDLVLLAGKGHEDYLEIDNKRIAYSERDLAKQLCSQESL